MADVSAPEGSRVCQTSLDAATCSASISRDALLMYDRDIRRALRSTLAERHRGSQTLLVDELGVCHGTARVDMAAVNGSIHGYEIKSAYDSLLRLEQQAECYARVCNELTLVCTPEHLVAARRVVPRWWGLVEATNTDGSVRLTVRRGGQRNRSVDPTSVAQLLWRDELILEMQERGQRGLNRLCVAELVGRLVEATNLHELQATVRGRLRTRPGWPRVGIRLWEPGEPGEPGPTA